MWANSRIRRCGFLIMPVLLVVCYAVFYIYIHLRDCDSYTVCISKDSVIDLRKFRLNPLTEVYEIDGKPILWQYWHDGRNIPLYVRLLIEAMQCRNPELRLILVHDSTIRHYLPDLEVSQKMFESLSANHRSDIFRVHIMYKYGGAYADVDTFVLDKLYPWYQQLIEYDFVTANWGNEITAVSAIGPVRARSRLFEIWASNQLKMINEKGCCFYWGEFGPGAMGGLKEEIASKRTLYRGYDGYSTAGRLVAFDLGANETSLFADVEHMFIPLKPTPYLFLYHSGMKEFFWNISSVETLLPQNATLYSAFVGCALLDCWPKYNSMERNNQLESSWVNANEMIDFLKRIDHEVCEKIKQRN